MAKQTINVGATANDKKGDSLRAAFQKVNQNFTELYVALGLDTGASLNLGNFKFTNNTMTLIDPATDGSTLSTVVINQPVSVGSNLTVGGDLLPAVANGGNIGSAANPWHSLYVSNNTIFIGGTPIAIDGSGNLTVNNTQVGASPAWANVTGKPTFATVATSGIYSDLSGKPTIPTLTSQLTNDSGFLTTAVLANGLDADLKGSVFADDSTLMVDAVDNKIYATELTVGIGNFVNVNSNNVDVENINGLSSQINFTVGGYNNLVIENNLVTIQNVSLSVASDITLGGNIRSEGNINIDINLSDSTLRRWRFGEDGNLNLAGHLQFPNGAEIRQSDLGELRLRGAAGQAAQLQGLDTNGSVDSAVKALYNDGVGSFVTINTNIDASEHIWSFDYNGDLTVPNYINFAGNTFIGDEPGAGTPYFRINTPLGYAATITTDSDISGNNWSWTFGEDGNLTLPGELHGAPVMSVGPTPSQVGRTVNITPADDASDKKFRFRVDQYAGQTFTRAYLELPTAEVDKQVAAVFPHANGTAAYIYTQGADSYDDGLNNAFNIFYNAGDIKLTAMTPVTGTFNTWKFGSNGDLTLPGNIQSEGNINIDINLSDSTLRRWQFGEDGNTEFPGSITGTSLSVGAGNVSAGTLTSAALTGLTNLTISTPYNVYIDTSISGSVQIGTQNASQGTVSLGSAANNVAVSIGGKLNIEVGVHEKFQAKADATGTVTHDCASGHIFYHTSPDANWTANFTNLNLGSGYATAVTLVIVQGGTGYYPNAVQIAGAAQTINWQGNTTPTPSTNRTDVVTFSIINNSGTYTVLGQLTGF